MNLSSRTIARLLLPFTAIGLLIITLHAAGNSDPLEPTEEMAAQTRWVVNTINARHYLRDSIQQLDGEEMVEAYIKSFDYSRMYFTQPEIEEFNFRFAGSMEGFLEKGNLYAAFEIYEAYKNVATERTEWALERLDQPWDFSVDETFRPDRRDLDWPANKEEAHRLWERRLKYELLNELLSLASETSDEESVSLERENPDLLELEEESFEPAKLKRLLEDEAFLTEKLDEAREKIRRRYTRNLKYTIEREAPEVQESFVNAMTQLFDPHSTFLSSDTLESFNSSVQNSFVGIGALLQNDDGICVIKELIPGGPAEESRQLEPEDQILGVAQGKDGEFEDVVDLELRYIVRKIKGEKGTIVRLLIRPGNSADPSVRKEVLIERDEVKLTANLASANLITVPVDGERTILVGVIELPSFYGNIGAGGTLTTTSDDVTELLNKLRAQGAQGIILDLRMNGGGLLSEAVRLAGLFIPVGPVVQVRDSSGRKDVLSDRDPRMLWEGPLIVLTSRFSASASEIVAGALQDHGRALIVGNSSTHGKGTVQEVYQMNNRTPFSWFKSSEPEARPVASKITIKQFYLPEGSSTQVRGVPSDIVLPSVNEFLPIGEDDLPHALPWGEIDPVKWMNNWAKVDVDSPNAPALLKTLSASSKQRQEELEEFQFLKKQIEWRRERFEQKEFTLKLAQRIERKIQDQAYIEQLDEKYKALKEENYPAKELLLEITKEQNAISEKNRSEPTVDSNENGAAKAEEEEEPAYDIYLRESARIMADWVQWIETKRLQAAASK